MTNDKKIYCADFETYYDDECSVKVLGNQGYFSHPNFDAYMLSVAGPDGFEWVGHPKDFDWETFRGCVVIAANASFDESLYLYGVEHGWYPRVDMDWECVLDACSYLGIPRSLAKALAHIFKHQMPKTVRDNMKGKRWETMTPEFRAEVTEYALEDARWALKLWHEISPGWPEWEREVSRMTRRMCRRGLPMDEEKIRAYIEHTKQLRFEAEQAIPWREEAALKSRKAFDAQCRISGIVPPKSLAKTEKETVEWMEAHAKENEWLKAYQDLTSINALMKKYEAFERGTINGRFCPSIRYCGTHTKRYSGSGGSANLLNLPRDEMFGTNMRSIIKAPPGKVFVNADLSQIEMRTTFWLAGAKKALDLMRITPDLYKVLAIMFQLWGEDQEGWTKGPENKARTRVKPIGLGVTFGMKAPTVATRAGIPLAEAEACVRMFLAAFPEMPKFWERLNSAIRRGRQDRHCKMVLPSGNYMLYRDIAYEGSALMATVAKGDKFVRSRPWHGSITENLASHLARDIMVDSMLRIEEKGWGIILQIYDEILIEVDEADAERCLSETLEIMRTPPSWIPDIPLDVEGKIISAYEK